MDMIKRLSLTLLPTLVLVTAGCSSTPEQTGAAQKSAEASQKAESLSESDSKYGADFPSSPADVARSDEADPHALITCANNVETRTLAIATKGEGCEFHYEKFGKSKILAWSAYSIEHCVKSRNNLRDKLVQAGWKCHQ